MVNQLVKKASQSEAAAQLAKQSPSLVLFIIMAALFLWFQERQAQAMRELMLREDRTTELRIEQCHAVQTKATRAIEKVADALIAQATAFDRLTYRLESSNRYE